MKKISIFAVSIFAFACCAHAVSIMAHQGEWSDEPANTAASTKKALELGSKFIEVDVQLLPSGEFVCGHDERTMKNTWEFGGKEIKDLSKEDILNSRLKKNNRYAARYPDMHISTLDDILAVMPNDAGLILDVRGFSKDYPKKFDEAVMRAGLKRANMYVPVQLIHLFRQISKEYVNAYYTIFLSKPSPAKNLSAEEAIALAKKHPNGEFVRFISVGQAGYNLAGDYLKRLNDKNYFRKLKAAGYQAAAWTTNDPQMARTLINDYGVDIIFSDTASRLRKALNLPDER